LGKGASIFDAEVDLVSYLRRHAARDGVKDQVLDHVHDASALMKGAVDNGQNVAAAREEDHAIGEGDETVITRVGHQVVPVHHRASACAHSRSIAQVGLTTQAQLRARLFAAITS